MTEAARVLVVDDEDNIRELVATALGYEGYEVDTASTGRAALEQVRTFRPDLVVLDVMLGDLDGFEVARRLVAEGRHPPVLFLTARDTTDDKVQGFRIGGDDYVTKPFSLEELVARVEALLTFADLELDDDTHEVWRGSTPIELTATEFRLLRYFLSNPRRVLSKTQILDHVWEYAEGDPNMVETYVSYLRKKLDGDGPPLVHTVRGAGYVLRTPAER
jgi:two-component system OmpR family response regulator